MLKYIFKFIFVQLLLVLAFVNTSCSQEQTYQEEAKASYGPKDLPRSAKYNVQLGLGYLEQGDVERAKDKFLKAVKQSPKMPQAHYNLAHFYYLIDEHKLAEQHFNKAINYSYSDTSGILGTAYNNFGVYLCQTKRFQEAYENFNAAISDTYYADTASAYENAGLCALKADDKQLAQTYFSKAVKHNPLSAKALIELGQLSLDNKNYKQAKFYLQRHNQVVSPSRRSLLLSLKIAKQLEDSVEIDNITNTIINKYPDLIGQLDTKDSNVNISKKSDNIVKTTEKYTAVAVNSNNNLTIKYTELGKLNKIT